MKMFTETDCFKGKKMVTMLQNEVGLDTVATSAVVVV